MSQKPSIVIPPILAISLADLVIDITLSGRTQKEITANAKALAPALKAAGGWQPQQPGEVFMRDDKPHLVAGFTRSAAAQLEGFDTGYFTEVPDDVAKIRSACIRTNMGRPIAPYEQGRIFCGMRDGTDTATAEAGQPILAPMSQKEIAADIGLNESTVSKYIAIFESPEAVRELIENDEVSAAIVYEAKKLAKDDDGKQLKILRRAIAAAQADGKTCATKKHFDAIKGEFAAKLKAAESGGSGKKDEKKEEKEEREDKSGGGNQQEEKEEKELPALDLGLTEAPAAPKKQSKKSAKEERDFLISIIAKTDEEVTHESMSDESIGIVADALIEAGFRLIESPI